MLTERTNPRTKRKEWCLVSIEKGRVLQYFGKTKPSDEAVQKVEARIEYFKNKGKKD
jgi:hypothetical protein